MMILPIAVMLNRLPLATNVLDTFVRFVVMAWVVCSGLATTRSVGVDEDTHEPSVLLIK